MQAKTLAFFKQEIAKLGHVQKTQAKKVQKGKQKRLCFLQSEGMCKKCEQTKN